MSPSLRSLSALFIVAAVPLRAAADSGKRIDPADLDGLAALSHTLGQVKSSELSSQLAVGLGALDLGHDAVCRDALRGVIGTTSDQRAMAALHAAQSCHAAGIDELGRVVTEQGSLDASRAIVDAVDKAAPETIFVRALLPLREEMEPAHFVLFRHLLGELRASLLRDGTSRARAAWSDVEQYVPALAAGLVRLEREVHSARTISSGSSGYSTGGNTVGAEPAMTVPRDSRRRSGPPLVAVVGSKVSVDGAVVAKAAALSRDKEGEDPAAPIADRLGRSREDFRARHATEAEPRRAIVRADGDVAFEVIRKVITACATAGYDDIDFAVPVHDRGFRKVRWSGAAAAPLVLALTPDPARVDWEEEPAASTKKMKAPSPDATATALAGIPDAMRSTRPLQSVHAADFGGAALTVESDAIVLSGMSGASTRIADIGGKPDEPQLARTLLWLRKQHGTTLSVSADDDVPMRRLLSALNLALTSGFTSVSVVSAKAAPPAASN